jgi:hypothetical protein
LRQIRRCQYSAISTRITDLNARIDSGAPRPSAQAELPANLSPLLVDAVRFRADFDRNPFGFTHRLSDLELFQPDSIRDLAAAYAPHPREYFVAASAPSAGTAFDAVPHSQCGPVEALDRLAVTPTRLLLKRPENRDPRFRQLLDTFFAQVLELRGGLQGERVVRLESAIFVTSAAATTPLHFDPEIAFFTQIEGEKIYHVYPPASLSDPVIEDFYRHGRVSIAQIDLAACDPAREQVYVLGPGKGLHQPQNSPHWVETRATRSVSYSIVFETDASRARGRVRAFNHYLRKIGVRPAAPGTNQTVDFLKSRVMRIATPVRNRVRRRFGLQT